MADLTISGNHNPATMSSREIAELTGKHHKHVLRDIRAMLDALGGGPDLGHVREDRDGRGYTICFHLDKELTETLVTGYSIPLRHKVIKRLHELESQNAAPAWIENLSPHARVVIEDLNSQVNHYRQETDRLNAVCNDLAANLQEGLTPAAFCRTLNGVNTQRVQQLLVERKRLLRTKHGYRSAAAYRDKLFTERRFTTDDGRPCEKVVLTLKGAKWLYSEYEKGNLDMKKDWDGRYSHILFDDQESAA